MREQTEAASRRHPQNYETVPYADVVAMQLLFTLVSTTATEWAHVQSTGRYGSKQKLHRNDIRRTIRPFQNLGTTEILPIRYGTKIIDGSLELINLPNGIEIILGQDMMKGLGLYVGGIQTPLAPIDHTELDALLEPLPRRQAPITTESAGARQRSTAELEANVAIVDNAR
ncbi:hypothetical protein SARC_05499 [Sphaeroforma arctica JP610]|uniref:Uncharacterized protein n=1 Tax=Sphaeroforma arctica JP610 TaxID=667725 RepID=A0A0L0G044_9EUKA|nr:hypothetical protein SARC_05499 [Sphaeroforma arctica JP610]KNC82201.1 hypothetical protein SARC_05499 [Sphaeroforma arctica JP610]|eukprot:XP_014156103.1 hypothetical protein SARC_05499 [Sphaeroforma arctica JP610]